MSTCIAFDGFELHPAGRRLSAGGQPVAIGGRAFDLLSALVERRHRVVGQHELLDLVWPGLGVGPCNLQVQVWALRKLLGREAIATVARRGYRFMREARLVPLGPQAVEVAQAGDTTAARSADRHCLAPLLEALSLHRLVTLVGPDTASRTALALTAGASHARSLGQQMWHVSAARLWQLEGQATGQDGLGGPSAAVATASPALVPGMAAALQRPLTWANGRGALLVLLDAHAAGGKAQAWVQRWLATPGQPRLLLSSDRPLGHRLEHVVPLPASATGLSIAHRAADGAGHRLSPGLAAARQPQATVGSAAAAGAGHPLRWGSGLRRGA